MSRDAEEDVMKIKMAAVFLFASWFLLVSSHASGQNLPPTFKKVKEGIFVYAGRPGESNCTIILTQEGVVLIDSGNNPPDSVAVQKAVKQLTPNRFVFSLIPKRTTITRPAILSSRLPRSSSPPRAPASRCAAPTRRRASKSL